MTTKIKSVCFTFIRKQGGSLGVIVPKELLSFVDYRLERQYMVCLSKTNQRILFKFSKCGNSSFIKIPRTILESDGLSEGKYVGLTLAKDSVTNIRMFVINHEKEPVFTDKGDKND